MVGQAHMPVMVAAQPGCSLAYGSTIRATAQHLHISTALPAHLFIISAVQIAQLAHQAGVYEAI